jgi:hypothetical protein
VRWTWLNWAACQYSDGEHQGLTQPQHSQYSSCVVVVVVILVVVVVVVVVHD